MPFEQSLHLGRLIGEDAAVHEGLGIAADQRRNRRLPVLPRSVPQFSQ